MRRLSRIVVTILAVIGVLTVAAVGLLVWGATRLEQAMEPPLPPRMVLTLDLDGDFRETSGGDPFAQLAGRHVYTLRDVPAALERAAADDRVAGLFATIGASRMGMAATQEIRDAVAKFRASGKPAVVFAETLGEAGNGTRDTYLASAFGRVWLQPSGDVGLTGFLAESPFLKGTLDLLGIQPQFGARYEYKSAIDIFTEKGFTDAHRRNLDALLESWTAQVVEGIAAGRHLPPETVRAQVGSGPLLAAEALSAGLVDKLGYRGDALAEAGMGPQAKEVDLADYAGHLDRHSGARIALITGSGTIHRGESETGLSGERDFGSATVAKALRDAAADARVKAILLRVDSPGGSYVASDTVWREVREARAAGKPVVVSMGDVAASGGYFVAMAADRVVAEPGTVTGSIGVFSGKMVLSDFWGKLGITWDELHRGANAGMWSANQPFSPAEWARMNALLDHIYADFTTKAAQGRGIPAERMDAIARGRVWSGADAKAYGLVDVLGGWGAALAEVRQVAKLGADAPLDLVAYPRPKHAWERLAGLLSDGSVLADLRGVRLIAQTLAPLAVLDPRAAGELRLPPAAVPRP